MLLLVLFLRFDSFCMESGEEKEKNPVPKSLIQYFGGNQEKLRDEKIAPHLLQQIISWIDNNEIDVNEKCNVYTSLRVPAVERGVSAKIIYALLHNPAACIVDDWFDWYKNKSLYDSAIISAHFLFTPFAFSRVTILNPFNYKFYCDVDHFANSLAQAGLKDTLKHELDTIARYTGDVNYLSQIINLNIIRYILFLGTYTETGQPYALMLRRFAETNDNLTGNEMTPDGTTALMFAVGGGYLEMVKELLRRGASPWRKNNYGDNAFSIAEIQLQRVTLQNDSELIPIYNTIQQELDLTTITTKRRAIKIAQVMYNLCLPSYITISDENSDKTVAAVSQLPYEIVVKIVAYCFAKNKRAMIRKYLAQLYAQKEELSIIPVPETVSVIWRLRAFCALLVARLHVVSHRKD